MNTSHLKSAASIFILFFIIAVIWGVVGNLYFDEPVKPVPDIKFKNITTNLIVDDVDETIEFYEETFQFTTQMTYPDTGNHQFAIIQRDSTKIMLQSKKSFDLENEVFKDKEIGGTLVLYVDVNNIDSLYNFCKPKVEIYKELNETFYNTKEFAIKDNSGYLLLFAEDI